MREQTSIPLHARPTTFLSIPSHQKVSVENLYCSIAMRTLNPLRPQTQMATFSAKQCWQRPDFGGARCHQLVIALHLGETVV